MSSKLILYTVEILFLVSVAIYVGWRVWHAGEIRIGHAVQILLASGLAVLLVTGGRLPSLLTAIVSTGAAISSFRLAFNPLLEADSTAALIAAGVGFSLPGLLVVLKLCCRPAQDSPISA